MTVSPKGRVHVVYLDRRDDPANVLTGASMATSVDHGKTFAVLAVSDVLSDSGVGPGSEGGTADAGSRLGVVATNDKVHVVWTDSRRGTRETGKQDLYTSAVEIGGA